MALDMFGGGLDNADYDIRNGRCHWVGTWRCRGHGHSADVHAVIACDSLVGGLRATIAFRGGHCHSFALAALLARG